MADTYHGLGNNKIKLVDLGDDTFAFATAESAAGTTTGGLLLASAARTTTTATALQTNTSAKGVMLFLKITAIAGGSPGGTGTGLKLRLYARSPTGGDDVIIAGVSSGANFIRLIGTFCYAFYPGAPNISTDSLGTGGDGGLVISRSMALPRLWYVDLQHQDATSYTYSLDHTYLFA